MTFKITEEQMAFFDNKHVGRFRDRMLKHFKENFAEETQHLNQNQMSRFITDGVDEAYSYDICSCKNVCIFLNIKVLLKVYDEFNEEQHKWILDILKNERLDNPDVRINVLADRVDTLLENQRVSSA